MDHISNLFKVTCSIHTAAKGNMCENNFLLEKNVVHYLFSYVPLVHGAPHKISQFSMFGHFPEIVLRHSLFRNDDIKLLISVSFILLDWSKIAIT